MYTHILLKDYLPHPLGVHHAAWWIAVPILFVAYKLWAWITPPAGIRHLPAVPMWRTLWGQWNENSLDVVFENLHREYVEKYPVFRVWFSGEWAVAVARPTLAAQVFSNHRIADKDDIGNKYPYTLKNKLLSGTSAFATTTDWQRQRKVINPVFHRSWDVDQFGENVLDMLGADPIRKPVSVARMFSRLTMDIMGRSITALEYNALLEPLNSNVIKYYTALQHAFKPLYDSLPILDWLGFRRKIHQETEEIVESFITKPDKDGKQVMTDFETRNTIFGFNIASIDTTSNATTTVMYMLARHQDIQDKVRAEVLQILGDTNTAPYDIKPTMAELKNMTYMEAVIKEAIRVFSPIYMLLSRRTTTDFTLTGEDGEQYEIPRGILLGAHAFGIQRLESVWPNPDKFDPDRWIYRDESKIQAGSFLVFGGGVRKCAGENLSMLVMKVALSMMLRRWTWTLPDDHAGPGLVHTGVLTVADSRLCFKPRF
ncbi:cytochrome P450 [Ramicandelaber brevisporus]|nr:cytochrome P450 [Ramicandelaber brevisporus]